MPRTPRYLTAEDAAEELGVTLATLYAYVSRGLVRSEPGTGRSRARRYDAEDVRRLKDRKAQRRDPEHAAREALNLGAPVLESAITLIHGGRFYYRGLDAVELARTRTLEEVAALIWTGSLDSPIADSVDAALVDPVDISDGSSRRGSTTSTAAGSEQASAAAFDGAHPIESLHRVLAGAAMRDAGAYDLRPQAVARTGAAMLRAMTGAVAGGTCAGEGAAAALARAWGVRGHDGRRLLEAAMILCVDHELNAAAFTARCAASAGATPYGSVTAGLAALGGIRHAGSVERVAALFDEAERAEGLEDMLRARLRRGEGTPGFHHPLYPDGDPRAPALFKLLDAALPGSPQMALTRRLCDAAMAVVGEHPVVDLGLVALARALHLPRGSALTLFAVGRTVGLVGQAIEQYATREIIRPRARYTGPQPSTEA